ncbi:mitochondrial inner membrane signal peptidase [Dunaliella salina]|uniref:Mitochondrial inner membrane protease subunit 2 n=1 Tax=Dunaliella salina TaxID=3046 RepID=A0ABQ7GH00_DUNSA|nr:mitochondrial inner membrane signal peptidase [Dunaliella salina]|eukprot:KAF5833879.1 mitochondrial inner membrane signal peptidase [Dunaliella salina]
MWSLLKRVAWSVPVAIAVTDRIATVVRVDGASMSPTFNPLGGSEWVLVEKLSYKWLHQYSRGDVAVLWSPDDPRQQLVKRVTGLEGDVVWDSYQHNATCIPQGRCWIEGDNPLASGDSRNIYGPVHLGLLEGRVIRIVWPLTRWGEVEDLRSQRCLMGSWQPGTCK